MSGSWRKISGGGDPSWSRQMHDARTIAVCCCAAAPQSAPQFTWSGTHFALYLLVGLGCAVTSDQVDSFST